MRFFSALTAFNVIAAIEYVSAAPVTGTSEIGKRSYVQSSKPSVYLAKRKRDYQGEVETAGNIYDDVCDGDNEEYEFEYEDADDLEKRTFCPMSMMSGSDDVDDDNGDDDNDDDGSCMKKRTFCPIGEMSGSDKSKDSDCDSGSKSCDSGSSSNCKKKRTFCPMSMAKGDSSSTKSSDCDDEDENVVTTTITVAESQKTKDCGDKQKRNFCPVDKIKGSSSKADCTTTTKTDCENGEEFATTTITVTESQKTKDCGDKEKRNFCPMNKIKGSSSKADCSTTTKADCEPTDETTIITSTITATITETTSSNNYCETKAPEVTAWADDENYDGKEKRSTWNEFRRSLNALLGDEEEEDIDDETDFEDEQEDEFDNQPGYDASGYCANETCSDDLENGYKQHYHDSDGKFDDYCDESDDN